uniref:Putative bpti/kunitz family of serine protease inhibitor n=1 Tax=Amblyomma tuberculatum TaxID=48802 RepID=A0A6M2E4C6_9ACAR
MNLLGFLFTGCALVAAVVAESSTLSYKQEKCVLPNNQPGSDCKRISLMYFYNTTSGKCENFRWTGCDWTGVFETLHECVSKCNEDQGAPFCASPPPSPCNETQNGKGRERYFYNITTQTCTKYEFCGKPLKMLGNNYFIVEGYCTKQCGGFNETTASANIEQQPVE